MSFMAHQEIGMNEIEQRELLSRLQNEVEPALAKENSKRNRKAKQEITERLSQLTRRQKELSALLDKAAKEAIEGLRICEEAEAARKQKAAAEKKEKPRKPLGISITCIDCVQDFVFGKGEQAFYAEKGLSQPTRCSECRAAHKASRPKAIEITCCDCHENFEFSVGAQRFFEENGWEQPTRCSECRKAKKAAAPKPFLINCSRCRSDFSFSVGAQKHFKEQGWSDPVRCKKCREEHKSETASLASSRKTGSGYDPKVDGRVYE